jgi:hypothetical protein
MVTVAGALALSGWARHLLTVGIEPLRSGIRGA